MDKFDIQLKVVLLGDPAVGKSSILKRFVVGDCSMDSENTVGAKYMGKILNVNDTVVKLNIWDTAGQERYQSFSKLYCRDAGAAILVYDVSDPSSFVGMKKWYENMSQDVLPIDCKIFAVGNKSDLIEGPCKFRDIVSEYASQINAIEYIVSAKSGNGIEDLFKCVGESALERVRLPRKDSVYLTRELTKKRPNKKKCC